MKIIGLMSGTSVDGIDAALTEVTGEGYTVEAELIKGITYPYPDQVRSQILSICANQPVTLMELAALDDAIAHHFTQAIRALEVDLATVDLIGSHGQTLYHRPPSAGRLGYTQQLGRGDLIASITGRTTISNFRVADIALGGQGAPLVPIIDACLLAHPVHDLAIQNVGGIGNVTYLPAWDSAASALEAEPKSKADLQPLAAGGIRGWDTGPGNALLDWAVTTLSDGEMSYDENGAWAAQGKPDQLLIEQWLQDPFFEAAPPKSTGRELFGAAYAEQCWQDAKAKGLDPTDFLATLTDFTAATIELSYRQFLPDLPTEVLVGGGGSRNQFLMDCLQRRLPECNVHPTDRRRVNADYKEAIAFAILAYWRWHSVPGNLPDVTGASRPCLLGEIWIP
ncbi:anhydro-N-acetylmuramic acid kinase [cf. Phormidesmis sp. LEGE 11477]|uniref:anhydro-N-acetylmuramic acid kinase n=1 Tax=cf. Phormidesmis sp. LEGE 11477 TaxID=1828680 RepID=UPI00187FACD8|nr:anhydro-N-acetylmuramic acid kinase [cf. Phormidesmis sp. LEGE 11477]MBE9060177.1 anhydro-N-acetylmuramic acid kinase [cf. Phormidesmis sp. LEGE 11477]